MSLVMLVEITRAETDIMVKQMQTLGTKILLKTTGLALVALFCLPATAQSTDPAAATPQQSQPSPPPPPAGSAPANQTPPPADQGVPDDAAIPKIRTSTNEVNVVFVVTDKRGKRITDLKQADFKVVDDNKPPDEIRSFHAEANLPLQLGLLIDASNSVRDRFKFEQESAIEFLNQTVRLRYDRAFVVGFDATPEVTQDFTDNAEQ